MNDLGQLGDGTTIDRSVPVAVAGGLTFTAIGAGVSHTCGVATGGSAYCWGWGITGALGDGTFGETITAPVRVSGSEVWTAISGGYGHTCALTSAGAAYCWGENYVGQLGIGTTERSSTPVAVLGGLTFVNLTTGGSHSCGVTTASVAYCWGTNDRFVPVRVEGQP
jgi:alpha-tubulin suppressor-like RCC1 family protein